jgi:hypothetical protein
VMLSDALPEPPQLVVHLLPRPLHEFSAANAIIPNTNKNRFEFMNIPHDGD